MKDWLKQFYSEHRWLTIMAAAALVLGILFLCIGFWRTLLLAALVSDGENGSAYVNLNVISDMAKRIAQDAEGVRTCKSTVKNNGSGVDVELEMALNPGVAVAPLAAMLQERLKGRVLEMTGIHVGKVSIVVEAAAEAKAPKQAAAEQLPSRVR